MEVGFWDAIVATEMAFSLVPEVLYAVDMVVGIDEKLGVIDPLVMKLGDIENIVGSKAIGVDNAVWTNTLAHYSHQCQGLGIRYDDGVYFPATLEQSKYRYLPARSATAFSLSRATEIAFINLNFAIEKGCFLRKLLNDYLAKLMKKQDRRIAIDPGQLSRRSRRDASHKLTHQVVLNTWE